MKVPEAAETHSGFFQTARYRLFWISSLFSNMGTWMQQVAQPWVLLSLNSSPFWVGLDGFAMNAPSLIFTLWGGVLADRFDKRRTVIFFQSIQFLCILAMVIFMLLGWLKVWIIVLISFLIGLTDSLSMPSFQSIIPSLVNPKDIHRAVSLNSTQFNLSRTLGPAIAGIVIVRFGALACFGANAASYLPFFLSLYFIYPRSKMPSKNEPVQARPLKQMQEFLNMLRNPEVRLPLLTLFVTNLFCGPLITFCAVLVKNVFQAEVGSFGGAMAAFGTGGLIGAASSFISFPKSVRRNVLSSEIAIFLGLLVIAISLNQSFPLLIVLLVMSGAAFTAGNIQINTFLQESAANHVRGRIASLYQLAISGGVSIGALFTGFVVSQVHISRALALNGMLAVALQIWVLLRQGLQKGA
jgi:predicted MFS family arabinose efflux permease